MHRNRNMNRSKGGNLNLSRGPIFTEHLKDIDLELDLLKRKREILQQQSQFLQPFHEPQINYNQQPFYLLEQNDFSHLYNNGPQQYRQPFGKKRQSDSDWQNQSYPKRSAGNGPRGSNYTVTSTKPNRNQRPFNPSNQQPKTTPFKRGQGKQSIGQRIANQKQNTEQKPVKRFVPTKVTKPKAAAAPPNKIASEPVADRGNLVATAIKSVAEVENRDREALRLVADKVPTKQMTGRLELTLGNILRDIKERCAECEHSEYLLSFAAQRVMKQAIRERVRTAMLGKIVGSTLEITGEYRTMFPKETDIDIVNKALEADGLKPLNNSDLGPIVSAELVTETANKDYKEHVTKLLSRHINDMFDKIKEIYSKDISEESNTTAATEKPAVEVNQDNVTTEDSKETSVEPPQTVTEEKNDDKVEANVEVAKDREAEAANGEEVKEEADDEFNAKFKEFQKCLPFNQNDMRRMMPFLLKNHISTIVSLLNSNYKFTSYLENITKATTDLKRPAPLTPSEPPRFYYVKVMGIPELPKRHLMYSFLKVFEPASIKKYKSSRNLLFVGLRSQKFQDEIVKADGTVIANMKLSIKVCDNNAVKPADKASPLPANQETTELNQAAKNDSTSSSDVLGTELDEQITDLLTSLKNCDDYKIEGDEITEEGEVSEEGNVTEESKIDNSVKETPDAAVESNGEPVEATNQNENNEVEKSETPENGGETEPKKLGEEKPAIEANAKKNASVKDTPTRASTRLASAPSTPSSVKTRRASRLVQN